MVATICFILQKPHFTQGIMRNSIRDSSHDKLDLLGISGTCKVGVDLLGSTCIESHKTLQEELASQFVLIPACEVREAIGQWALGQLFGKEVDLVQEQNNGRLNEPLGIADRVE
jgi:hypothetical protein